MDERSTRITLLLMAHLIFLSAFALRIRNGERTHRLRSSAPWWVEYAPPLAWVPWAIALLSDAFEVDVPQPVRFAGLGLALAGALFAAWSMWRLGRSYAVRMDVFAEHQLVQDGPFALVRHPLYLGVLGYHVGAFLALGDLLLAAFTVLIVLPLLAYRAAIEERVLLNAFGDEYRAYRRRVPALLPFAR
jgi:protein-S-isoprenylcysteine O-methyltransferase Ste14